MSVGKIKKVTRRNVILMAACGGANLPAIVESLEKRTLLSGIAFATSLKSSADHDRLAVLEADLNGDGQPDLVIVNKDKDTVKVLLRDPNGGYQPPEVYSVPRGSRAAAVVDLGNGEPDIVVTSPVTKTVTV